MMKSLFICSVLASIPLALYGLQFPWALSKEGVTESTASIWDLRRPDFPVEQVEMFLNQSIAGVTYPNYLTIPPTNFTCQQVEQPGFYSDPETGCQVYHRCDQAGNKYSFLCGNQTIFDQLLLTCDFFYKVDCPKAKEYFNYANIHLYTKDTLHSGIQHMKK